MTDPNRADPTPANTASANAAQIEAWNTRSGVRWAAFQAQLDAMLAPLTEPLLAEAAVRPGEHALDIGCGCGATVLDLAAAVGPHGSVLGVDVSDPMLAIAERRIEDHALTQARVVRADAASHPFDPGSIDLVFSRFGVMFFDAPVAAFRNIRSALRPGGRLVFVCWQPFAANAWMRVPAEAVLPLVPAPPPSDPEAPGPFAFAKAERVCAILAEAGFSSIAIRPEAVRLRLGGPGELDAASDLACKVGPAAVLLASTADPAVKQAGQDAIRACLAALAGPEGIVLDGAVWLVFAQVA